MARYLSMLPLMWRSPVSDARGGAGASPARGAGWWISAPAWARRRSSRPPRAPRVLAVDPTPFMRRILKLRRLAHPQRAHVTVLEGAAEALPFEAATIDALWTVNTVHHWSDLAGAVRELRRVLRPGGGWCWSTKTWPTRPTLLRADAEAAGVTPAPLDEVDPQRRGGAAPGARLPRGGGTVGPGWVAARQADDRRALSPQNRASSSAGCGPEAAGGGWAEARVVRPSCSLSS